MQKQIDVECKQIESHLKWFNVKNKEHLGWLSELAEKYSLEPLSSDKKERLSFLQSMRNWLDSQNEKNQLKKIQRQWDVFSLSLKVNYGCSMDGKDYRKLQEISERRNMSLNAVVRDLIHSAHETDTKKQPVQPKSSLSEEVIINRFDKLESLLMEIKASGLEPGDNHQEREKVAVESEFEDNVSEEQQSEEKSVGAMMFELTESVFQLVYFADDLKKVNEDVVRNLKKSANRLEERLKDEFGNV